MLVYHTSDRIILEPDTLHSRRNLDFGRGFYVTKLKGQAEKYSGKFIELEKDAYLHVFEYSPDSSLRIKVFQSYDEEWLRFVCACRKGDNDYQQYDIIDGGVANDKVFKTVELFMDGDYTVEMALKKLRYEKPNHQICFISQKAIDQCLKLIDYYKLNH